MTESQYYRQLNESLADEATFHRWTSYRQQLTEFIIEHISSCESALVIGAGNCNDISLGSLLQATCDETYRGDLDKSTYVNLQDRTRIVLSDIDGQAMERGCERQGVSLPMAVIDYTGLSGSVLMERFKEALTLGVTTEIDDVLDAMVSCVQGQETWTDERYDYLIVLPIHTQIFYRPLEDVLNFALVTDEIGEKDYTLIQRKILDRVPLVIQSFNNQLRELLKCDGDLVMFTDCLEDVAGGYYDLAYARQTFQEAYDVYYQEYGMGLGHYGIYEMEEHMKTFDQCWLKWPMEGERCIFVKGVWMKPT